MFRLSWEPSMKRTVDSVMTAEVVAVRPLTPFRDMVRLLEQHRISALPVVDDAGQVVGIVSEADLLVKEGYPHGAEDAGSLDAIHYRRRLGKATGTTAAEVMAAPVTTVAARTTVVDAARLMVLQGIKRLPVVDEQGKLVGIVTRADLLKVFLRPDPAIGWEVEHDIVGDHFGFAPGTIQVQVRGGVVSLRGEMERRSQVPALIRQVQAVEGVVEVDAQLTWRINDQITTAPWPVA
jgi:CBS domain-containing protein